MIAKRVFYEGRVQGVGFRYQTKQIALGYEVVGWVRNLADGRVELQIMGDDDELDDFFRELEVDSALAHHILEKTHEEIPPLEGVKGFKIA